MSFKQEWVRYGAEQEFSGLAIWPERASKPLPAVLVIQEAWGVDAHIEDVTRRFAAAGYVALAADLFSRNGARVQPFTRERLAELQEFVNTAPPTVFMDPAARDAELAKRPEAEANRIRETMGTLFSSLGKPEYLTHLKAAAAFLRTGLPASKGQRVAAVGFCMGGGLAALLACHDPELAAAAVFYGSAPADDLIPKIRCPVIDFYGSTDQRIAAGIPAFVEAMKKNGKQLETHEYGGVGHAFMNDNRPSYDAGASRDSWVRTLQLFHGALG